MTIDDSSVTLQQVVEARKGSLNEIEAWAVLAQSRLAVTHLVESASRANVVDSTLSRRVHVSPATLRCTANGRVVMAPNDNHKAFVPDDQLVGTALQTLANTLAKAMDHGEQAQSTTREFQQLLTSMANGRRNTYTSF